MTLPYYPPDYPITSTAEIFGVSRTTVFNWIKAGKLKAKKVGNQWYIPEGEITRQRYGDIKLSKWREERQKLPPEPSTMLNITFWLGINRKTAYKWIKSGKLKAEKISGKWCVEHDYLLNLARQRIEQKTKGLEENS